MKTITDEQIIAKLEKAQQYKTDSTGRRMAIKLYRLLEFTGSKMHPADFPAAQSLMTLAWFDSGDVTHQLGSVVMMPDITDKNGEIDLTARRALIALKKAGLIKGDGLTKSRTYWI